MMIIVANDITTATGESAVHGLRASHSRAVQDGLYVEFIALVTLCFDLFCIVTDSK